MSNHSDNKKEGLSSLSNHSEQFSSGKKGKLSTKYRKPTFSHKKESVAALNPAGTSSRYQIHHQDQKINQLQNQKLDSVKATHPKYLKRHQRLDMITNNMLGMVVQAGSKQHTVCDISKSGYSYAQEIGVNSVISFEQLRKKIDEVAVKNYGKNIATEVFFKGEENKGKIKTKGTIRNHTAFLGLLPEEIEREVTAFLYSKSIRRNKDPLKIFEKFDLLKEKANEALHKNHWNTSLCISMNTTALNLLKEVGADKEIFNRIYNGYKNKQVFLKFGVAIQDEEKAKELYDFAISRGEVVQEVNVTEVAEATGKELRKEQAEVETTKDSSPVAEPDLNARNIRRLNKFFTYKTFLERVWINCLKFYKLDPKLPMPVTQDSLVIEQLKKEAKYYHKRLERIEGLKKSKQIPKGTQAFLIDGLYWHLVVIDEKYFDKSNIQNDIKHMLLKTYKLCLKEVSTLPKTE